VDEIWGSGSPIIVDLLYGDHEGGQRAVTRFSIWPTGEARWLPGISRHFRLDGVSPRD
jgi:hypothetical protein